MQNITLVQNIQTIWLCKKISDTQWAKPIKKRVNIAPTNSDAEIEAFGAAYVDYMRIKLSREDAKEYVAGYRVYYNKKPPLVHNGLQNKVEDANYTVELMPTATVNVGTVYLKRLPNR